MKQIILSPTWEEYELIDSGEQEKYERFGPYTFVRPETKALWKKAHPELWEKADATFIQGESREGRWKMRTQLKESWQIRWNDLTFKIRPTSFKHMGVFPENAAHWEWMQDLIRKAKRPINVLNLFAYTGGCTLAGLAAGASVTHVDASKSTVTWAHENAVLSGLAERPVRWIVDDAMTFVKREIKRGRKYDGIILDPPKFGRAENGKIWKFEQDFPKLLELSKEILSEKPLFFIVNAYTVEISSLTLGYLLESVMGTEGQIEHGEILLKGQQSYDLPTSIIARWSRV
jgi:23S rRNA (cytosine1962-C5)-methyltransferase